MPALEHASCFSPPGGPDIYVSNRNADQKEATRQNLEALGFPMGGNVDTLLMQKEP
jgi:predicted secreted acid phosphatase